MAGFIGETNIVPGEVAEVGGEFCAVKTAGGLISGRVSDPDWRPVAGEGVRVSIRPEAWRLHQEAGDNPTGGLIVERTYLGQRIQYWVESEMGRQQVVEMNPHVIHELGVETLLHARRDDVVVLKG